MECFEKLKRLVCEAPVTLTIEASGYAVEPCISEDDKAIAYAPTSLRKALQNYAQIEK